MKYFNDRYGIVVDSEAFARDEHSVTSSIAQKLMQRLDVELSGCFSESRGGFCFSSRHDGEIYVEMQPNHVVESDDNYWVEDTFREFALLLTVGSKMRNRIEETRRVLRDGEDLDITLIRSSYTPDLRTDQRDIVEFSLDEREHGSSTS